MNVNLLAYNERLFFSRSLNWKFKYTFFVNSHHIIPLEVNELIDRYRSGDHIGMFYRSEEERVIYIDRYEDHSAIIRALQKLSVDTDSAMASGQLSITDCNSTYLSSGDFDADRMINRLKNYSETTPKESFSGLRIIGNVPCNGGCQTSIDNVVKYERELNHFFPGSNVSALCLYSLSLFPEDSPHHSQILSAHPLILRNNKIFENLHYQPPLKKELVEWRHPLRKQKPGDSADNPTCDQLQTHSVFFYLQFADEKFLV